MSPAAVDRRLDLVGVGDVGLDELRAELLGERGAALLVEIGDGDVGAGGVQRARGGGAQAGRAAGDERIDSLDLHGPGN